jgi:hypothetical protein
MAKHETTFHNVTITVVGEPKEAYARLCELLGSVRDTSGGDLLEYETDTYTHYRDNEQVDNGDTTGLMEG